MDVERRLTTLGLQEARSRRATPVGEVVVAKVRHALTMPEYIRPFCVAEPC